VLEHARAGERALLGDVTDEQDGHPARLREPGDAIGDLADLADRAGRAGEGGGVERLHRVDDADLRPLGVERREHGVEVGLREHRHVERGAGEPLGTQADLPRRLLAGDVQRAPPGALQVAERHRRERRLADAGRAADQHDRAGDDAAAEDAVELADAGREAGVALGPHVGEPDRLGRAAGRLRAARVAASLFGERVPRAAARALPVPLGGLGPAGRADEDGGGPRHGLRTVGAGADDSPPRGLCPSQLRLGRRR
jgi:hypothetical protein